MEKWVSFPMHEVGVRRWEPPTMSKKEKARIWALILAWLTCLGILLALFAFGEVEAAEFSQQLVLTEVEGGIAEAMVILDDRAKEAAKAQGCLKIRRVVVMFDFHDPLLPIISAIYVCAEKITEKK